MTKQHSRRRSHKRALHSLRSLLAAAFIVSTAILGSAVSAAQTSAPATISDLNAWSAANLMGFGVNIGNTLENTTTWETGWGNPPITKEYIQSLAAEGFKT